MIPFLDMKAVYAELKHELDAAYARVMESGWFVLGKEVEAFEAEYAAFCGTAHCVGSNTGGQTQSGDSGSSGNTGNSGNIARPGQSDGNTGATGTGPGPSTKSVPWQLTTGSIADTRRAARSPSSAVGHRLPEHARSLSTPGRGAKPKTTCTSSTPPRRRHG